MQRVQRGEVSQTNFDLKDRITMIEDRLRVAFSIESIKILDQSHLHVGHAGAASGGGHFDVTVVSKDFDGLDKLARHRRIYEAIGEAMNTEIHALSIRALSPGEK